MALDLPKKEVIIVEVSEAANINSLTEKIRQREIRWYAPVIKTLIQNHVIDESWEKPRFLGIVRKSIVNKARDVFSGDSDVAFIAVEHVAFPWEYWNQRMERGVANKTNQETVFKPQ